MPTRGRGVFGGQVISLALVSATNCIDPSFGLHSLHCYFLSSASPATPIVYFVERLRQGRSYVTCSVKAVQEGSIVFMMLCSFQKPEPWQPSSYQWQMPTVPPVEDCELEENRYLRMAEAEDLHPSIRKYYMDYAADRKRSPIAVMVAKENEIHEGKLRCMYWMKARNIPEYEAPFQKCILSYLSDLYVLGTASRSMGLRRLGKKGPDSVGMTSTIDHAIHFYNDNFDCGSWLLYEMDCSRGASGRAIIHGRLFTVTGTLIAVVSQEGVVRANVRGPQADVPKLNARL